MSWSLCRSSDNVDNRLARFWYLENFKESPGPGEARSFHPDAAGTDARAPGFFREDRQVAQKSLDAPQRIQGRKGIS